MSGYERPRLLSTYSAEELAREAATCASDYGLPTPSDRALKEQVEGIEDAVEGVASIRTR